jgi:hypothetical protein
MRRCGRVRQFRFFPSVEVIQDCRRIRRTRNGGRRVAHHAHAVVADVPIADVVAPDDEDARFVRRSTTRNTVASPMRLSIRRQVIPIIRAFEDLPSREGLD